MTQDADVQGLQRKAESRLASLKNEKLVTRIAVVSTLLGTGKITKRLMIGMSVETHKTSPDFDHEKCGQAKSRIMRALDDIDRHCTAQPGMHYVLSAAGKAPRMAGR